MSAAPGREELVRLERAALGYGRGAAPVLAGVDLAVRAGDFLAIVGPNGAGKSTLLKSILGLLPPLSGRILLRGVEGAGARASLKMGYVPQRQALDPIFPLRVLDVVVMGLYGDVGPGRRPGARGRERALAALERAQIAELAPRLFRDLSGGQQQRTLVARALVAEPDLLVLDEPTNDLDLAGEKSVMDLVSSLNRAGKAVLMVSHLLNVVLNYASALALVRDGRVEVGPMADMLSADVLERMYGFRATVAEVSGRRVVLPERRQGARE